MAPEIQRTNSPFGAAPTFCAIALPSLKIISVGMIQCPLARDVWALIDVDLGHLHLVAKLRAISSSAGPIRRQGLHHPPQKSTTTGSVAFSTSELKLASVTLWVVISIIPLRVSQEVKNGDRPTSSSDPL